MNCIRLSNTRGFPILRFLFSTLLISPFIVTNYFVLASPSTESHFRLLHRLYTPSNPESEETLFSPRAYIQLDSASEYGSNVKATLVSLTESDASEASVAAASLDDFARSAFDESVLEDAGALYQVAIERVESDGAGLGGEGKVLSISSIRACHLPLASSAHLVLHLTSPSSSLPFAIDQHVSPTPLSGACPSRKVLRDRLRSSSTSLPILLDLANTTVEIRTPVVPPLPALRTPPPLTPEGAPVQPVPEKSFVQKYWIYIAVGLFALMLAPGPPEEGSAEGGSGGGGR
ncbi:hypothetical protein SCHPADRAFT_999921 [Schizopora paradoxa]|uniref:Uncharacterized protein n=1 Tax=Schizopora paradoxa TaxID=27342 RepID=A0A0H2RDS0_9AGAM|nr:hypothetical protein SCHPADRAFT_999921 [Schizopora paradoxa]